MCLHIAVGHRAKYRDSIRQTCENVRSSVSSSEVGSAGYLERGVGPVSAPRTEVHNAATFSGLDDACCFCCRQTLKMDLVEHQRLHELCLQNWRDYLYQWLGRKGRCSFRNCIKVSREPQIFELS